MTLALEAAGENGVSDAPEEAFGPYRLIEKIGEGGMGIVWLARQEHPIRRDVALKVVKPGADSAQVLSRFESERQALAILNHPNIATVFDAGLTDDGRPYFAMEYVAGVAITTFADQHALPIVARLELFLQVCEAVEHAHQKGVLHRDLKPANILVSDRDGRPLVKVIDFGVAKALAPGLSAETIETQIGTLVGTPGYMSPEQAGLTESVVDTRTDIYSLGLVLYELLVGALPFDASELRRKAVLEMLRVIREEEPPRLASRLTSQTDGGDQRDREAPADGPAGARPPAARRSRVDHEPCARKGAGAALRLRVGARRGRAPPPRERAGRCRPARSAVPTRQADSPASRHRDRRGRRPRGARGGRRGELRHVGSAERARRENRERLKTLHVTTGLDLASDGEDLKALPWLVRALQLEEGGARAQEVHRIRINHVLDGVPHPVRIWKHEGLTGAYLAPDRTTLATWDQEGTLRLWNATRGESIATPLEHKRPLVSVRIDGSNVVTADEQGTIRVWNVRSGKEAFPAIPHGTDWTSCGSRPLATDS